MTFTNIAAIKYLGGKKEAVETKVKCFGKEHPVISYLFMFVALPMLLLWAMILCIMLLEIPLGYFLHWSL
ncbi:MAG TPA: hypothetical protein GX401_01485 [Clostridiales bacterium]|nr:hypothetical protein [Clostridiales bacterium]